MASRLDAVLTVIYLVFNEGYAATRGGPLVRTDLCAEAIRLGAPGEAIDCRPRSSRPQKLPLCWPSCCLHDARRDARLDGAGDLVVLEEQDRSRWDQRQIAEALPLVDEAFRGDPGASRCRRRSQPCIARRRAPKIRTGRRSCGSTTCWSVCSLLRSCR